MRFIKAAGITLIFKILAMAMSLAVSVIISRILGADGRGQYGIIMTIVMIFAGFSTIGINTANTYFISKDKSVSRAAGKLSLLTGLAGTIVSAAVLLLLVFYKPNVVQGLNQTLLGLTFVLALLFSWGKLFSQSYLGLNRAVLYNLFNFMERLIFLVMAVIVLLLFNQEFTAYMGSVAAGFGVFIFIYILYYFSISESGEIKPLSLFRESVAYGIRPYVASLFTLIAMRSALFFVNYFRGTAETGLYSVAQQFSELLIIIPTVVGSLLFPRVAGSNSTTLTARVLRVTGAAFLPVFLVLAIFTEPLIVLLFGQEFVSSVKALLIMLPGAYVLGLEVIIAGDIAGRGYPWKTALIWVPVSIINAIAYIIVIPSYGIEGAAWVTSLSFIAVFIYMVYWLKKMTGMSLGEMFVPTKADFKSVLQFLKLTA